MEKYYLRHCIGQTSPAVVSPLCVTKADSNQTKDISEDIVGNKKSKALLKLVALLQFQIILSLMVEVI